MHLPARLFLACVAFLSLAIPAAGQKFQPKSIQFKGAPEYSSEELMAAAGLQKGVVLDYAGMNEHSKRLMDSGVFASLAFKFDGQDLVFTISPAAELFPIHLGNLPIEPGAALDTRLHERLPLYHGKVPAEGGLLDAVGIELQTLLAAGGIDVQVVATPYTDQKLHKVTAMNFSAVSPEIVVGSVRLEGVAEERRAATQRLAAAIAGTPFDTEGARSRIEADLRNYYNGQGCLETETQITALAAAKQADGRVSVPFAVTVKEGPVYRMSSVTLAPGLLVSQAEFDKASPPHPGALATRMQTIAGRNLIENRYKQKGYLEAEIRFEPTFDRANGTAAFTVKVVPGPVYRLGTVKFENVSDDLRRALLHNWQLAPDDPLDEVYVLNFPQIAARQDPALLRPMQEDTYEWRLTLDPASHIGSLVIRFTARAAVP